MRWESADETTITAAAAGDQQPDTWQLADRHNIVITSKMVSTQMERLDKPTYACEQCRYCQLLPVIMIWPDGRMGVTQATYVSESIPAYLK